VSASDDADMSKHHSVSTVAGRPPRSRTTRTDLLDHVAEWAAAGLIDNAQAQRIISWEAENRRQSGLSRRSVLVEALAYGGGAVIAAALLIVTFGYWDRFDRAAHIAIPAGATAALLIAGLAVPRRLGAAAGRVRATAWLVSVATGIGLLVVLIDVPSIADESRLPLVGGGAAIYTAVLWLAHRSPLQHAAAFGSILLFAVSLAQPERNTEVAIGVVLATVALAWGVAAWRGLLPGLGRWLAPTGARRGDPWTAAAGQRRWGMGLSAVGQAAGAVVLSSVNTAPWVGLLPVLVILIAAIALTDVGIVVIGAISALIVIPAVVENYLHSTLAVALVLLATGAVMLLLAVLIVRRHGRATPDNRAL
jgi:hypothetical protein